MRSSGEEMTRVLSHHHDLKTEDLVEAVKGLSKRQYPENEVVLLDDVEVCGPPGGLGGFLSLVLRLKVSYRHHDDSQMKTAQLIVKKMPSEGLQSNIIKSCRLFRREKTFYWGVVRIIFQAAGEIEIPFPYCYHASECCGSAMDVIYMEDLCLREYRIPDRKFVVDGLDFDHCILAVRTLGKLHGMSYAAEQWLSQKNSGRSAVAANAMIGYENHILLENCIGRFWRGLGKVMPYFLCRMKKYGVLYKVALFAERLLLPPADEHGWWKVFSEFRRDVIWFNNEGGEDPSIFQKVVEKRILSILKIAKEIEGLPRTVEESGLLKLALDRAWEILCRLVSPNRSSCNVLNHGDCWTNNMMFKYEEEGEFYCVPSDMKLIDFQFSKYSHPAVDFLYFLYTSTNRRFREKHLETFLSEYHSSMLASLKSMGCDEVSISLADLKEDLLGEYKPFGVIIGTLFAPALKVGELREPSSSGNPRKDAHEQFIMDGNSSEFVELFNKSPKFRSFMEDNVRELVECIFPNKCLDSFNPYWV